MSGRYVSSTQAEMIRYWELTEAQTKDQLSKRVNVSPTMTVPMIYRTAENLDLVPARWELVPYWWKEAQPARCTFNARSEDAETKAVWRHLAATARCLVPALGWYA